jgi:netrin-G3 ligand
VLTAVRTSNLTQYFVISDICLLVRIAERGVEYEFRVAGQNHIGFGQETIKYLLTPEGPPSGPPTNITHHFQTPDVVSVTWDVPLMEHRNGQITHYDIEFHKKVDHTTVTDRNTTQMKVKQPCGERSAYPRFCRKTKRKQTTRKT